jgi:hypothetical protein
VTSTSSKGIMPGPKDAARPMIQNKMATVKIVQNTIFLLNAGSRFQKTFEQNKFGLEFAAHPEGALKSKVLD